ncbi:sensor histidine kinase [Aliihoeflea sp. PC F10.4]
MVQSYQDSIARAETRVRSYSQVVSSNVALLVEGTYQALRRIDSDAGDALAHPSEEVIGDLNRAVESLPPDVRAWLIDANGVPRLSNSELSSAFNVADRDYFVGLKEGQAFRVSPLMISRTGGDPVFAIAKRIERNGVFMGAAVIIIPATYLDRLRGPLELGPDSTAGLIRDDGQLVTRSPIPSEPQDLSQYVLFTRYLPASPEGTYAASSPTDRIKRIVAYRRIPNLPLVAVTSISTNEALATFWRTSLTLAVFGIPGLIGLGTFAFWSLRAQRELSAALQQNQLLFREIHHRVKNNLQQAMSLINMHGLPADVKAEISRRLSAMAAVHEHMYRADQYNSVLASAFLPGLIDGVRQGFARQVEVYSSIAPALLDREKALPIALIVSEVMSNAAKHAFPDGREGQIDIVLERLSDSRARLSIADNGIGHDSGKSNGTGTKLVTALARQLDAQPRFVRDGGTRFEIEFDVDRFVEHAATKEQRPGTLMH